MANLWENALSLFGYEFVRRPDLVKQEQTQQSFTQKENDDGSAVITASGNMGAYVDLDGTMRTEAELIAKYREISLLPDVDQAINEIVNEAISVSEMDVVKIDLDDVPATDKVKEAIQDCFDEILDLLEFNHKAYYIFHRFYVDGRENFHAIIDETSPETLKKGIQELRYIDPRKIRKVREVERTTINKPGIGPMPVVKVKAEYYMYSESGFNATTTAGFTSQQPAAAGLKIATDAIVSITSGVTDASGTMILSYLHKAIKPVNVLRAVEDATVIYRLARAPERRVWYIDVGNLPKAKAEQYVKSMMDSHKNKLTYDVATGAYRDQRKFMCLDMSTKVPLLDGRTLTLTQIAEEYRAGKRNWVYSCDPVTGEFMPGPVEWAGVARPNAEVVRVTLDNGESIVCTPDHKFPVWGEGMVEAKDLAGKSIIPGYRRKKTMHGTDSEYEQIFKNDTKKWEYTHREVARWKDGVGLREELTHEIEGEKKTIHHVDFNKSNNSPDNLVMMNRDDHLKFHRDMAKFGMARQGVNRSEDFTSEWRGRLSEAAKRRTPTCKTWKVTTPIGTQEIIENLSSYCRERGLNRSNIKGDHGSKKYFAEELRNHKCVSVEPLDERMDTGCLTVDRNETYHSNHTFLLEAGVYNKNTMLEDYWLPRREGGKGTQVETLPSGEHLGKMEDVEYFQRKLYQALNVPITRLQPGDAFTVGRATEVTRDEVAFGKFITRLRTRFGSLFTKILEKQVVLKQIMSLEDWQKIASRIKYDFANDNYFMEMKESEVMMNRMDLLERIAPWVGRYYSNAFVEHNILRKNDEEIDIEQELIEEEKTHPIYSEPMPGQEPPMDPSMMGMGPEELPPDGSDPFGDPDGAGGDPEGPPPGQESLQSMQGTGAEKPPKQRKTFKLKDKGKN